MTYAFRSVAFGAIALWLASGVCLSQEKTIKVRRFRMNPFHTNIGKIIDVAANGTVMVSEIANPRFALSRGLSGKVDLTEGLYLGLVAREFVVSTSDTRLVRLEVVEVGEKGRATIQIAAAAASEIAKGEHIVFFRPPGSTTAELKAAPDFVKVDDGRDTSVLGKNAVNAARSLSQSRNQLKQIGLAMHNFHDVYRVFPPAVIYGPDGRPWHSWRVLVLPFIEQQGLYERYKFDEPWDGPNNSKLLSEMPEIYRDPIHDDTLGHFTHYAAVSGKGTIFPSVGIKMDEKQIAKPLAHITSDNGATGMRQIFDGTSNTLMVGTVSPENTIPWMKPEDINVDAMLPGLGEKGNFAAPYGTRTRPATLFLFSDGSVRVISTSIERKTLQNLFMMNDGNPIGDIPTGSSGGPRPGTKQAQMIEVIYSKAGTQARLVSRAID